MKTLKSSTRLALIFLAFLALPLSAAQERQQPPPGFQEYQNALRIEDLNARINELERIKAAYPGDMRLAAMIDSALTAARIGLCPDVPCILELQKSRLASAAGLNRLFLYYSSSLEIIEHKNLALFDKKQVTEAVSKYAAAAVKLAEDQDFKKTIPDDQKKYIGQINPLVYLALAKAHLNEENLQTSLEALDSYRQKEGEKSKDFYYILGTACEKLGKNQEAFEAYFEAAAENYQDSLAKAKALYEKIYGSLAGFGSRLEAKQRELPYHPRPFQNPQDWQGKAVLAELFTGSECPPCAAADLGFDGLIEASNPKSLAILEYHLPIPRPDPIMNQATKKRQDYYGVNSTPSTFFDGESKHGGGGPRTSGEQKFKQYAEEVNSRLSQTPEVQLKAKASLQGNSVNIDYSADKLLNNADYNIALAQKEEKYAGSNGIVFHKMVVREFLNVEPPQKTGNVMLNLEESEKAAEKHLLDFEKEKSFQFKEKHFKIDRTSLRVIFFVQDRETRKVYNAVVADVK